MAYTMAAMMDESVDRVMERSVMFLGDWVK